MDLDVLAPVSRLTDALARRAALPQNPAAVLARLMDFSGGVALAELLQAPSPRGLPQPEAGQLAQQVRAQVRARLDAALPLALGPLIGPRAPKIPPATELLEAIVRVAGGPNRVPKGEGIARFARELGAPRRAALGASLREAAAQFSALRSDIASELRALGPAAARLERIDAALQRSIQVKLGELFARMERTAELTFGRACAQACAALPANFGADELASWGADGGWIARYREHCERLVTAWFGHLQRSLEGLLLAVETGVQ